MSRRFQDCASRQRTQFHAHDRKMFWRWLHRSHIPRRLMADWGAASLIALRVGHRFNAR